MVGWAKRRAQGGRKTRRATIASGNRGKNYGFVTNTVDSSIELAGFLIVCVEEQFVLLDGSANRSTT